MVSKQLIASVKRHEGFRTKAYQDTVGVWTIGYGTNLQELEIDKDIAEVFLMDALEECRRQLETRDEYQTCSLVRREVLIEMCYNMGYPRLSKFKKMWAAIDVGNYTLAAKEMLDSLWAAQVGQRAVVLAARMEKNLW